MTGNSPRDELPPGRSYTVGCLMRSDVRECFLLWEVDGYLYNSVPSLRSARAANADLWHELGE
jgi:hypothetical protein